MINKTKLQSIISKYYLNGLVQSVRWLTENNKLSISFVSENKDICGDLICNTSPVEDSEIAIFDTAQLNRLISVTNGELLLTLEKQHKIFSAPRGQRRSLRTRQPSTCWIVQTEGHHQPPADHLLAPRLKALDRAPITLHRL